MKNKLIIFSLFFAATMFFLGKWAEDFSQRELKKIEDAGALMRAKEAALMGAPQEIKKIDEKISSRSPDALKEIKTAFERFPELSIPIGYREAELMYIYCEERLSNFIFFRENAQPEQAGEERDAAGAFCRQAHQLASLQAKSANEDERFLAFYSIGNLSVRMAMLAVSREQRIAAWKKAVESYIAALKIKDDYDAKFNLELLLLMAGEGAMEALGRSSVDGSGKNDPNAIPAPQGGFSPGGGWKSKL